MTKKELALEYWDKPLPPNLHTVTNWLCRQINQTKGLKDALMATGYKVKSRELTPSQIAIIVQFIGPP